MLERLVQSLLREWYRNDETLACEGDPQGKTSATQRQGSSWNEKVEGTDKHEYQGNVRQFVSCAYFSPRIFARIQSAFPAVHATMRSINARQSTLTCVGWLRKGRNKCPMNSVSVCQRVRYSRRENTNVSEESERRLTVNSSVFRR